MKQKLKEAQLAEKRERREQKQQQREDKAMSRKQEKENRQMLKEQQKKDAQKQKEQARENFRQIREQEAEERNLRNQLVQNVEKEERPVRPPKKELSRKEEKSEKVQEVPDLLPMSWTASYIPLKQVKNGIIQTSDNRFVKIVEVLPINFLLRSSSEQRSIILSFMSYLKIAPPNIQLKVLSRKADIQEYIDKIDEEAEKETDERCKILQEDYAELIKSLGMKEAITRRFFLIFEYPSRSGSTDIEYPLCSYQAVERAIRIQISYDALKNDHPYDRRVEEILGLILDVMVSTAPKLRINREEKDIEIVKAQFAKLTKDHVEFVLQSMDDTSTKARNIRAVLLTALYNSVNTINSYYGNRYHFHLAEETRREMEETD